MRAEPRTPRCAEFGALFRIRRELAHRPGKVA